MPQVDYWRNVVPVAGPVVSGVYFVSLLSLGSYVVLNLLVAAIIAGVAASSGENNKGSSSEVDVDAADADEAAAGASSKGANPPSPSSSRPSSSLRRNGVGPRRVTRRLAVCHPLELKQDNSLLLFGPSHPVRIAANALVEFQIRLRPSDTPLGSIRLLEAAVVALTIAACARLTVATCHDDAPPHPDQASSGLQEPSSWYATSAIIDDAVTLASLIELCARLVGGGATLPHTGYFHSPWRRLDAVVVAVAVGEWLSGAHGQLIVLRVLRPLWLLVRIDATRKLLSELAFAVPRVAQFMALYLVLLCIYGVLGVQLLSGRLGSCVLTDATPHHPPESLLTSDAAQLRGGDEPSASPTDVLALSPPRLRSACVAAGGAWLEAEYGSFDDIAAAMLMLFEVSSLARWAEIMEDGVAAAPTPQLAPLVGLYFVVWVLFGGLVLINMVVGVIVDRFAESHRATNQWMRNLRGRHQQQWSEAMHHLKQLKPHMRPRPPDDDGRQWGAATRFFCYRLVTSAAFERGVLLLIALNTLVMALDGVDASPWLATSLDVANSALLAAFSLELVAKLLAFGWRGFHSDGWNRFDALVVGGGILDVVAVAVQAHVAPAGGGLHPSLLRLLRLLRVTRALRAIRSHRGLRSLLATLFSSLPDLANVLGVFGVIIFAFSALGMELFGRARQGGALNEDANFCTFPSAFMTLFVSATGEGWNSIMHDAAKRRDGCDDAGDCGSWAAYPFFTSYTVVAS